MRQIRVRIGSKLPPLDGEIGPALATQIVMREALGEIHNATDRYAEGRGLSRRRACAVLSVARST